MNLHIAGMIEDGDMLPEPTLPSQVPYDPDIEELARMLIPVSGAQPKVRVNVMLDANVLQAIDMVSDNRSQFLTAAAKAQLRLTTSLPAKSKRRRVRSIRAG